MLLTKLKNKMLNLGQYKDKVLCQLADSSQVKEILKIHNLSRWCVLCVYVNTWLDLHITPIMHSPGELCLMGLKSQVGIVDC